MNTAPPFERAFLHPRWWPTWFGIALLWAVCQWPVPWLIAFGEGLGRALGKVAGSRRHVVRTNLRLCFPELSGEKLEAAVDAHFAALGAGAFEAGLTWFASDARLLKHVSFSGLEHLRAAAAQGGVLLFTGHFTTLELGARLVATQFPFHAMYRPIKNPVLNWGIHRWRAARTTLPALPRDNLRQIVKALREGRAIWYAPDQTLASRDAVVIPFLGVPVPTLTATSRLAEMGRARVLPYFPRRIGRRYEVSFMPALEGFPTEDEAADTVRVMRSIEDAVRAAPEQYFWVHRKFKPLTPGAPDPYA